MESTLTFDQLPSAISLLRNEIDELKKLVLSNSAPQPTQIAERFLNIQETGVFLNLSVPTIYSKVSKGELPVMKRGNRLYFSEVELLDYLKGGKKLSNSEAERQAEMYLSKVKKK